MMSRIKIWGLAAGYSLLLMAIIAGFAFGYVHNMIYIPNDTESTHSALKDNWKLFQFGVASWVLIVILDVIVSVGIYVIYWSTNSKWAALAAMTRLVYTAVFAWAVTQLVILLLNNEVQNGLVYFNSFETIWSFGLIVFGLHLMALGWTCWKSEFTPLFVSVLLLLGGLSYVITESSNSFPSMQLLIPLLLESILTVLMVIGELTFALWLIVRSTRLKRYEIVPSDIKK